MPRASQTVKLTEYDAEQRKHVETGETVHLHNVAKNMSHEQMAILLGHWVNGGGKQIEDGRRVGKALYTEHRYLQHCIVFHLVGILHQMGKQEQWDPRNERALEICRKLSEFLVDQDVYLGRED